MHTHANPSHTKPERSGASEALIFFNSAAPAGAFSPDNRPRYSSHGRAALASALDEGLMPDEVAQILGGRRVVDAFPVWRGETSTDYAARAVAEMFVAYLR